MQTSFLLLLLPLTCLAARPNIIIIQPDDLEFYNEWTPPAHFPGNTGSIQNPHLPNIERLRSRGVTLSRAHTASPACGTSRYSSLTGRYPSRSSFGRQRWQGETSRVNIPRTKLLDVPDFGNDCSSDNIAALLQANGYRTGVIGKWHLHPIQAPYNYGQVTQNIRDCGFEI